jgi:transposase
MNPERTIHPQPEPQPQFAARIGLDWGDQTHALALQPLDGPVESSTLVNSPEALHAWLQGRAQRFAGRPVALAVETSRGPLIHVFSAYPWLEVYPVHPATSARYRTAFKPSGAKDDQPDALLLLDLLRRHPDKLRRLQLQDTATRKLAALVELRRDVVDRRTQAVNQLISLLKSYYPQALELAGTTLTTQMAMEFLSRWPDPLALKTTRPATLKKFYYRHSVRSKDLVAQRLELAHKTIALTTDEAVLEPALLHLRVLVDQLRTFQKHVAILEQQIETLFQTHSEADLFRSLPGAGEALQPRLLVAFGQDRTLYPDPASLQKFAGLAPVVAKSGGQCWVHWRWQAPRFLRQGVAGLPRSRSVGPGR